MNLPKKMKGRPQMQSDRRDKKIDVRFTEEEFKSILAMEKEMGIRRTEIIRLRVLKDSRNLVINARDLLATLDSIGTELGRTGNNINQLAKYANTLNQRGILSQTVSIQYNRLLAEYNLLQQSLEVSLRKIIREMGK